MPRANPHILVGLPEKAAEMEIHSVPLHCRQVFFLDRPDGERIRIRQAFRGGPFHRLVPEGLYRHRVLPPDPFFGISASSKSSILASSSEVEIRPSRRALRRACRISR